MSKRTKEECLEFIDKRLNEKEGKAWTRDKFLQALKIPKRTFHSYLSELKGMAAKIKNRRIGGYYYEKPFTYKTPLISKEDAGKLYTAINILKELDFSGQPFDMESVILKLEGTAQIDVEIQNKIVHFEHQTNLKGWKEYFDKLFIAINDKKVLSIKYKKFFTDNEKTHIFHPYFLKEYHNRWYLFGRIEEKQELTTLALDRIEAILPSDIPFKGDNHFDADNYFKNAIGITLEQNAKPQEVLIRVVKKQVPYFENQPLHGTQKSIQTYKNGDVLFSLNIIINIELKMLLMQYANTLKVVGPKVLKTGFTEMLETAVKLNLK